MILSIAFAAAIAVIPNFNIDNDPIVPCGTDAECAMLNPGVVGYGTDKFLPNNGIEEDDPRWDCATMGNHICGPALIDFNEDHIPTPVSQENVHGGIVYTLDNGTTFHCIDWMNGEECTGIYSIDSRS